MMSTFDSRLFRHYTDAKKEDVMGEKRFSLRIEESLLDKFAYIAEYNARSINGELQTIIKKCVSDFEKQNGQIPIAKSDE